MHTQEKMNNMTIQCTPEEVITGVDELFEALTIPVSGFSKLQSHLKNSGYQKMIIEDECYGIMLDLPNETTVILTLGYDDYFIINHFNEEGDMIDMIEEVSIFELLETLNSISI